MDKYEKKYKEALERAKERHRVCVVNDLPTTKKTIEAIFPELAEIEDKRASELLHQCVCRAINSDLPYDEREEISKKVIPYLEMLEKQKKQSQDMKTIKIFRPIAGESIQDAAWKAVEKYLKIKEKFLLGFNGEFILVDEHISVDDIVETYFYMIRRKRPNL